MADYEIRFPPDLSRMLVGGPSPEIDVIRAGSGKEQRNQRQANPPWKFSLDTMGLNALDETDEFADVRNFIIAVGFGRLNSFRLKYWGAYRGIAEAIGTGDGGTQDFQLSKTFSYGGVDFVKPIYKPVNGTVVVKVGGAIKTEGVDYTIDYTTGLISFTAAPGVGVAITADFEFDFRARFDQDYMPAQIRDAAVGTYESIGFEEVI